MTRYFISFDDGAMTFAAGELPDVARAAHEVVEAAKNAGVWVSGGGINGHDVSVIGIDGIVTDNPYPASKGHLGGFAIVDVPSRQDALEWARKIAVACRCAQDVRELMPDSAV